MGGEYERNTSYVTKLVDSVERVTLYVMNSLRSAHLHSVCLSVRIIYRQRGLLDCSADCVTYSLSLCGA